MELVTANLKLVTANYNLFTANYKLVTANMKLVTANLKLVTANLKSVTAFTHLNDSLNKMFADFQGYKINKDPRSPYNILTNVYLSYLRS